VVEGEVIWESPTATTTTTQTWGRFEPGLPASGCWYSAGPHPAGLAIGHANPPEHADQPLTYDDVELDDGSAIVQVCVDCRTCFSGMTRQLHVRRSRHPAILRTRMGLPMPTASP